MAKYLCVVCKYAHQGWKAPSHCPICGAQSNMFQEEDGKKNGDDKKKDKDR
jgi:rubrerythrin